MVVFIRDDKAGHKVPPENKSYVTYCSACEDRSSEAQNAEKKTSKLGLAFMFVDPASFSAIHVLILRHFENNY